MIAVVAVVAVSATGAFFSDTETSTGNTFTAGAIDLTVDSTQHYNHMVCTKTDSSQSPYTWQPEVVGVTLPAGNYPVTGTPCSGTWEPKNLGAETFFNFPDVKPGDSGENTISLHVDSNDAYACVDVNITKNDDNGLTGPELAVDTATSTGGVGVGELAQHLNFFAWADIASTSPAVPGDNIWQASEQALFSNGVGPASDVLGGKTYTLADSTTGPLAGGVTKYIGLAWCAGSMTAVSGVITCDGSTMGNDTQTDTMEASVAFRVEQARNNAGFTCATGALSTVRVSTLQPDFTTAGGGGVWSAYYFPNSTSAGVSPGSTTLFDGRQAGIIKAGITPIVVGGNYEDEGILAFQVPSVAVATFAGQVLTYDVENQTGTNPVWVRIRLVSGIQYQFVPASYGVLGGYHTINAAAGQWQLMDGSGNGVGSLMTLSQVATNNAGAMVDRVYLTLGIGNSYNVSSSVGTVGRVDKITIGGVTYDFVI